MLPGDLNVLACGIATFAATIGYAYSRRHRAGSISLSSAPSVSTFDFLDTRPVAPSAPRRMSLPASIPSTFPQHASENALASILGNEAQIVSEPERMNATSVTRLTPPLGTNATAFVESPRPSPRAPKRKRSQEDDAEEEFHALSNAGYPDNLKAIYPPPKKRSRTPSSSGMDSPPSSLSAQSSLESMTSVESDTKQDNASSVETVLPVTPVPTLAQDEQLIDHKHYEEVTVDETPRPQPTERIPPSALPSAPMAAENKASRNASQEVKPPTPGPATRTPPKPKRSAAHSAFAAFAGPVSPFAIARKPIAGLEGQNGEPKKKRKRQRPVWAVAPNSADVFGTSAQQHPNQVLAEPERVGAAVSVEASENVSPTAAKAKHVLDAAEASPSTVEHHTGEENEDVELELKSVKLFIKRGEKPFSEGLIGHVKLLSNKTTLDERLLFRREPLWQVSMNVKMCPTVRCTYDAEENVLRLILLEQVEQGSGEIQKKPKMELVVYALKPVRSCSKQDFKDFANALKDSVGLKDPSSK